MPTTAIFVTIEEYTAIVQRLSDLESLTKIGARTIADAQVRIQSLESTISSASKMMANFPTVLARLSTLETKVSAMEAMKTKVP